MKQKPIVPGLSLSIWIYRWLMKLHTPQFQSECTSEMLLHHEDAYREAWNRSQFYGVMALWLQEGMDLVPDLFEEFKDQYQTALRQEGSMRDFLSFVAQTSSKAFMAIAGLVAAMFWISLSTRGAFQSSIEQSIWFIILFDGAVAVVGLMCLGFWKPVAASLD